MIKTPIAPIVHEQITQIMCRHYGMEPVPAAKAATKLIQVLRQYDLDIIRGDWTQIEVKGAPTVWERMSEAADAFEQEWNGIKRWNPPELQ